MTTVYSSQRPRIIQTVTDSRYTFTLEIDSDAGTKVVAVREVESLDADWLYVARKEMADHNDELMRGGIGWDLRPRTRMYPPSLEASRAFMRAVAVIFPDVNVPEAQTGRWMPILWKLGHTKPVNVPRERTLYLAVAREMVDLHRDWSEPVRFRFQENEDGTIELWLTRAGV